MSLMAAIDRMTDALTQFESYAREFQDRLDKIEEQIRNFDTTVYELSGKIENLGKEVDALVGTMPDLEEITDSIRRSERLTMLADARAAMKPADLMGEYVEKNGEFHWTPTRIDE